MDTKNAQSHGAAARDVEENVGRGERVLSIVAGVWMLARGLLRAHRSTWSLVVALAGLPMIRRGATGHSRIYQGLGIDTWHRPSLAAGVDPRRAEAIEGSIVIERPVADVYGFWRRFENLPQFFAGLDRVRRIDGGGWRWIAAGPLGRTLEWDVDVTQDVELRRIAWRSRAGSVVASEGVVEFRALTGATEVVVRLLHESPGGRLGVQIGRAFGFDARRTLARDLARLKLILEGRAARAGFGGDVGQVVVPGFAAEFSGGFSVADEDIESALARAREDIAAERTATIAERTDLESDQSFPASDPPSRY